MKFNEITETASAGSTSAGSVAPVVAPVGKTHTRKGDNLLTGKRSKGKYANSVEARKQMNLKEANVTEEDVMEKEVLVIPGSKKRDRKSGFVPHGESRVDHEVKMAKSDLFATAQNAQDIMRYLKDRSEEEGIKGWMQSYITLANDYLNSVKESLQYETQMHEDQLAAYGNGADDRINTRNKLDKEPYGGPSSSYPGGQLQSTSGVG
ncbi:MAG: hypothetical protein H8E97_06760 [Bacteroidetes bacterium]|mgnify:FL=1|jgi:hypothetical protein|nr:hypothetical protein [Bacteroidota bacterium]